MIFVSTHPDIMLVSQWISLAELLSQSPRENAGAIVALCDDGVARIGDDGVVYLEEDIGEATVKENNNYFREWRLCLTEVGQLHPSANRGQLVRTLISDKRRIESEFRRISSEIDRLVVVASMTKEATPSTWVDFDGKEWPLPDRLLTLKYGQRRTHRALKDFIFDRDSRSCQDCYSTEDLVIDHIVSVRNGGSHHPSNLVTLCGSCNSAKAARVDTRVGKG